MKHKYFLLLWLASACLSGYAQNVVIKSHDPHIHYMGRINMLDEAC